MKSKIIIFLTLLVIPFASLSSDEIPEEINMYFGGDTFLSTATFSLIRNHDRILKKLDFLSGADLVMVNLETTVTENENKVEKKFNFKALPEFLEFLKKNNIKLVNVANNHIFDYGKEGLVDTLNTLDRVGIVYTGAGRNIDEARKPVIMDIKGRKIGFLSCYGTGWCAATADEPGVYPREGKMILRDIKSLKNKTDFVVVNVHWGTEKLEEPEDWQIKLARKMADCGADSVIGHHSHTVQGMENYKGSIIVYSIGNFLFESGLGRETAMLNLRLKGETVKAEYVPLVIKENLIAESLSGEKKAKFLENIEEKNKKLQGI